jgi:hypothetical protein
MRRQSMFISAGIACAVVCAAASGQAAQRVGQTDISPTTVTENFAIFFDHEPGGYFHEARLALMSRHFRLSADATRRASAQFRLEAHRAGKTETRSSLLRTAAVLDSLAADTMTFADPPISPMVLDRSFARAHCTLGMHKMELAKDLRTKGQPTMAGRELMAMIENIESGFAWAGQELERSEIEAMESANMLAKRLATGARIDGAEFDRTVRSITVPANRLKQIVMSDEWGPEPDVVVERPGPYEAIWVVFADQPAGLIFDARHSILAREHDAAAKFIRRAEAFIRIQGEHATTDGVRHDLLATAGELELVAYDLDQRVAVSVQKLNHIHARAELALAKHFKTKAVEAHKEKDAALTGHYLTAAASHLERAAAWTDEKVETAAANSVYGARFIGRKLMHGVGWTAEEVGKGIETFGKGIENVGKWFSTRREEPAEEPAPSRDRGR